MPDLYDQIEADLAAEDARVGEWPPEQWWREQKAREFSESIDDAPLVRDNDGEPVDLGQPWTRRDKIEFALFVVLMTGAVALVWWGAGR